ncbi:SPX-domain-containing protein [Schizopora paradoxa]|uniref:SPX-domain-containing protein n=1 Tax=Schizopora paradoxa TaxID=27342 RepID=A0A0H2S0F7_9AGAM|nr:SPX-domain-containing protein [Schizopora paradoxa]
MKFSNSLKFNAVAEWWDEYIAYSALKKQIYLLEKAPIRHSAHDGDLEANERSALMGESATDNVFRHLLDGELKKVCEFYMAQEQKVLGELSELEQLVKMKDEESFTGADRQYMNVDGDFDDDDDDDDDETAMRGNSRSRERHSIRGSGRRRTKSDARPYGTAPALSQTQSLPGDPRTAVNRRYSVSSSEDNLDLEASLASLTQIPENGELRTSTSLGRAASSSPKAARATISSIFNFVKPGGSVSSSMLVPETIWTAKTNYAYDTQVLFKRRIATLYSTFTSLRAYVELNYSGFRKILKKYESSFMLKDEYMHNVVEQSYPFLQSSKDRLDDGINRLVVLYAKCVTRDDTSAAKRQLKIHQREHIAWERDTVWRQMIGQERRGETDGQVKALGGHIEIEENAVLAIATPVGKFRLTRKHISLVVALVVFVTLLNVEVVDGLPANNCLAVLIFSTIMWASEAIPLFVTSMLVPLLLVVLRVFVSDEFSEDGNPERLDPPHATTYIFRQMFSPTIMLLIGGFTIASAISKTNIDRVLVTRVLSLAGTRPNIVLLSFMGVSCFASMWIRFVQIIHLQFNLCIYHSQPILRNLPPKSSFAPCIIIGIALAANIGGQSSPISSPQNLIALQNMDDALDWGQWFAVALPVSAVSIILIWLLLLVSYRPSYTLDGEVLEIKEVRASKDPFTFKQYWVSFVCVGTIILWLIEKRIESWIGDMGVIAIIPIVAFFSTGVLRKDDFEQFLWTIVFLAMGGIALGKGVTSSGLLELFDEGIRRAVDGLSLPIVVMMLSAVVLVRAIDISLHNYQRLLVFLTGLLCSTGMGMPVSGFPNQTAANQEDDIGQLYLTNVDFLKNGVPASIISAFVVATLGYGLCLALQ